MNFEHVVRCENLIGDIRTSFVLGGLIQNGIDCVLAGGLPSCNVEMAVTRVLSSFSTYSNSSSIS